MTQGIENVQDHQAVAVLGHTDPAHTGDAQPGTVQSHVPVDFDPPHNGPDFHTVQGCLAGHGGASGVVVTELVVEHCPAKTPSFPLGVSERCNHRTVAVHKHLGSVGFLEWTAGSMASVVRVLQRMVAP